MKKTGLLLLMLALFVLSGCDEDHPTDSSETISAKFTFTGNTRSFTPIVFESETTVANKYLWDFGDGTSSSEKNPEKIYETTGSFDVTLEVSDTTTGAKDVNLMNILIEPGRVSLKSILLKEMDFVNNGVDGTEIIVRFFREQIEILNTANNPIQGIHSSDLPVAWNLTSPYVLQGWSNNYSIKFYEVEGSSVLSQITTQPIVFDNYAVAPYPDTILVGGNADNFNAGIVVMWE